MSSGNLVLDMPLQGSQLIEASAGTGKTFTIALLYVRLILNAAREHDDAPPETLRTLLPPNILVTTFTNLAAEELKTRIRARLVDVAAAFRADQVEDDLLAALRDSYPEQRWPRCARLLEVAAEWMDQAAISTIHAWAQQVLTRHAFDSNKLFDQELVTDRSEYETRAIQDYWRIHYYPLEPEQAAIVRQHFASPDDLQKALKELLKRPGARPSLNGQPITPGADLNQILNAEDAAAEHLATAVATARKIFLEDAGTITSLLRERRDDFDGPKLPGIRKDPVFEAWLETMATWAEDGDAEVDTRPIRKFAYSKQPMRDGKEKLDHPFFHALDDWTAAEQIMAGTKPAIRARLMAEAFYWVQARVAQSLEEASSMGFDEQLANLDAALSGPRGEHLAQALRTQYPVAMIDEFQDTDPVQYRIFDHIYNVAQCPRDRALILIGDPKQAIYSFRGADIYTYLQARQATAGRHHHLGTNFRSAGEMVKAVNTLFAHAEQQWPDGAFRLGSGELPFQEVDAKGREEVLQLQGKPPRALTAWWTDEPQNIEGYRNIMAEQAAEQISQWLSHPDSGFAKEGAAFARLRPRDIAVLVRSGKEADRVRDALRARGLASVYLSERNSVFASPEAGDVLCWLEACARPDDDTRIRQALATRSLNLPLETLDRLRDDELAWEAHQARFSHYHTIWQHEGVLPALRQLLQDYRVAEQLRADLRGDRTLTNLLHLAEWSQDASISLDGTHALLRTLEQHIRNPQEDADQVRLESEADLIKVLTIHKSKGLEYPLVVAPFAAGWSNLPPHKSTAVWRNGSETLIELLKAQGKDKGKGTPEGTKHAWAEEAEERAREDLRLLYVALTRARHACFIGVAPIAPGGKTLTNERGALGYLLSGKSTYAKAEAKAVITPLLELERAHPCLGVTRFDAEAIGETRAELSAAHTTLIPARSPAKTRFEHWSIASYSMLKPTGAAMAGTRAPETATDATRDEELEAEESEAAAPAVASAHARPGPATAGTLHSFPRGPGPGTFLHGLLEWAGGQGFKQVLDDPDTARQLVQRRCDLRGWGRHGGVTADWLLDCLAMEIPAPDRHLRLNELDGYRVEAPFHFAVRKADAPRIGQLAAEHIEPEIARPALAPFQLNGLMKGFIDLVATHQGRYYVIDWKSNYLGPDDAAYHRDALAESLMARRYDVQCSLYLLALHRHLQQRLPDYDYDRHLGGALFVFLRGHRASSAGVWQQKPDRAFIEALDAALGAPRSLAEAG